MDYPTVTPMSLAINKLYTWRLVVYFLFFVVSFLLAIILSFLTKDMSDTILLVLLLDTCGFVAFFLHQISFRNFTKNLSGLSDKLDRALKICTDQISRTTLLQKRAEAGKKIYNEIRQKKLNISEERLRLQSWAKTFDNAHENINLGNGHECLSLSWKRHGLFSSPRLRRHPDAYTFNSRLPESAVNNFHSLTNNENTYKEMLSSAKNLDAVAAEKMDSVEATIVWCWCFLTQRQSILSGTMLDILKAEEKRLVTLKSALEKKKESLIREGFS